MAHDDGTDANCVVISQPCYVTRRPRFEVLAEVRGSLPSELMTTFRGRVAGGSADLATWMIRSAAYERAVGVAPEPGSFNVRSIDLG